MVKIIQEGDKILRKKAKEVLNFDNKLKITLKDMEKALQKEDDGVALAAPQIGVSKRIFIVSNKVIEDEKIPLVYINPKIIKKSKDSKKMEEGCLSVRWKYGNVRRSSRITIEAQDQDGKIFKITATKLLAQIFQHEIEHLDGILFIDHAKDVEDLPPKHEK